MKQNFRAIELPMDQLYVGECYCTRCGKEFPSHEMLYGVRTDQRASQIHAHLYCPTDDCNGYLNNGVYSKTVSS